MRKFLSLFCMAYTFLLGEEFYKQAYATDLQGDFHKESGTLQLHRIKVSQEEFENLCTHIRRNVNLRKLDFIWHQREANQEQELIRVLGINTTLQELDLGWNNRSNYTPCLLTILLPKPSLKSLNLRWYAIDSNQLRHLSIFLENTQTLSSLILRENQLGTIGGQAIGKALHYNTTLTELDLSLNQLTDRGGQAILQALSDSNKTLKKLSLSWNELKDKSGKAAARIIYKNSSLTQVNLSLNQLGEKSGYAIAQAITVNTSLQKIDLSCNYLGKKGVESILQVLPYNLTLREIDLRCNRIEEVDPTLLEQIHSTNPCLQLYLDNNKPTAKL